MPFATRADLLARANARRLFNLAVPADFEMPPDDLMRVALTGGDLSAMGEEEQKIIKLALDAIDKALADADALLVSYGVPQTAKSSLLARLASTVAFYYLHSAEQVPEDVRRSFESVEKTLSRHSRGELAIVPSENADTQDNSICISSERPRYGAMAAHQLVEVVDD